MTQAISLDWLTLNLRGRIFSHPLMVLEKQDYGTRQFREVYKLEWRGRKLGTLVALPYLLSLGVDFMQLKIENQMLYDEKMFWLIDDLLSIMHWSLEGISRIDFCIDFEKFNNGWDPRTFLKRFAAGKVVVMNKSKFALSGEKTDDNEFDYLRMGAPSSAVRTILYNKTKEMSEVKQKPWISDVWKQAGLTSGADVWRVEFSLKHDALQFVDKDTSKVIEVTYENIKDDGFVIELVRLLVSRYFKFVLPDGQKNQSRRKVLDLLGFDYVRSARLKTDGLQDVGKSLRQFAARLTKEVKSSKINEGYNKMDVIFWAQQWLIDRRLTDYCFNRGLELV